MLSSLSGKKHFVLTAYAIIHKDRKKEIKNIVKTEVFFKKLTILEINDYIKSREPFGKAGAYAIQGLGACFVKKINGSYTNVVGLPLCEITSDLKSETFE